MRPGPVRTRIESRVKFLRGTGQSVRDYLTWQGLQETHLSNFAVSDRVRVHTASRILAREEWT